jgi:small-conductance mechanosensitive channel
MNEGNLRIIRGIMDVLQFPLFHLGQSTVTLESILQLVLFCAVVLITEYVLRRQLTMRVLRHTMFDPALQYGIARIGGYIFILFGFYVALNAVGINLNSLAVVAGAIGVGIGFGLQNIVQNFISGIIILAERPIALEDRIEVGNVAGTVKKISLRSTEVLTNDNISIIVPNSEFVTKAVTNWSHGDPRVRIRVPVGVAYGSDMEKLKAQLLAVAAENPDVLKEPAARVFFDSFGDSTLNFQLAVWTQTMTHKPRRFRSDLNFAIEHKLRTAGIEIPCPQHDLNIRSGTLRIARAKDEA